MYPRNDCLPHPQSVYSAFWTDTSQIFPTLNSKEVAHHNFEQMKFLWALYQPWL